jgi:hypothetical protein
MKIKNFIKGNYRYMPDEVDTGGSVYYGKIEMTYPEFVEAVKYLMRVRIGASYDWALYKRLLKEDLQRKGKIKNGFICAIRVPATLKLVEKYKLARYKTQNYYLEINYTKGYGKKTNK